ncbi:hypothetical protein BGZ83_008777 [Gryganskiella cystojenkinii]|nr:hypothetical protein BGZ83_008777 [Gryganskiella cystojenkinii]
MYSRVPKEKIAHNKRVLTMKNGEYGVRVECNDGSFYEGDILVGADGAYSPVRQGLYRLLKRENKLPSSDEKPLPYSCVCLVGQTSPLDPEEFPSLKEKICDFNYMNSMDIPYTVRDFVVPIGNGMLKTMGDLIDRTPSDLISKVVLEEKVFKTWYSGRTVLLGDACHKLSPSGGAGAICAIQDALCLANWINVLPENTIEATDKIFSEYYTERHPIVMAAYRSSQTLSARNEKSVKGAIIRFVFDNMPHWLWLIVLKKSYESRPQASFLPHIEDKGTVPPSPQRSYIKTRAILVELAARGKGAMEQDNSQYTSPGVRPKVIIVGAGLGGLTLGLLLEKAGVPYTILERASAVKPLGSALSLGAPVFGLFRQLGIFDEFAEQGKRNYLMRLHDDKGNLLSVVDFAGAAEFGGDEGIIVARPILYSILYNRVPKEKILHNKRVLTMKNGERGVRVECNDGSFYEGDILVGADGAYSPVRQGLYRLLKRDNKLPASDDKPLPYNIVCLVGQTTPLDPDEFPCLKEERCTFNIMESSDIPYVWCTFTTKQNTICWMVLQYLNKETSKEHDSSRDTNWGSEAVIAMSKEVRAFSAPVGDGKTSTVGDLIDWTPTDLTSKVVLEEKVFKTWYSGRTVLIGDACHKLSPSGGQGAISAMQDALCLANWINVLPENTTEATENIFEEYYKERYPVVMEANRSSQLFAARSEKSIRGAVVRYLFNNMPKWLWVIVVKKMVESRPQASFLPRIEDRGTNPPIPQPSYIKTRAILEQLATRVKPAVV